MFVYSKQIFDIVPRLNQDAQDTVCLIARCSGYALCHFLLYHTCATGNQLFVVQHLKEDLTGYIIGIVAGQHERVPLKSAVQVHFQKIILYDILLQRREMLAKVSYRLKVDLHHLHQSGLLNQELRHNSHAWSNFQNRNVGTGIYGVGNVLCDA